MACSRITTSSLLGNIPLFDATKPGCDNADDLVLQKPLFFGKNNANQQPIFAVMDYERFKISRTGMMIASASALILGIATIVLAVKLHKKK
jgi:hypothetical protein